LKNQTLQTDKIEDSILWGNLKMGDEKAFSILFKKYYGNLVQYGNSLSPYSEKVQDCVQDVFTDVWVYRQSLGEAVVVKAYLLSCVRNRIARLQERDHIFRQSTSMDSVKFLFEYSVEHQLILDEALASKVAFLNKLLNDLPGRQKEALYLRYHQGLTVDQIAEILDVNYQSANNLLHRALLHLRKEWKGTIPLDLSLSLFLIHFF
jgi:RNA polymerase sigma factor (sigma-70 family)